MSPILNINRRNSNYCTKILGINDLMPEVYEICKEYGLESQFVPKKIDFLHSLTCKRHFNDQQRATFLQDHMAAKYQTMFTNKPEFRRSNSFTCPLTGETLTEIKI